VTTLNRFPTLGLWAEEAARRLGYRKDEAESLGHAYAVLYAISANRRPAREHAAKGKAKAKPEHRRHAARQVQFGGDELDVTYAGGHVRGKVGGGKAQTPATYEHAVEAKFPPGYYERLRRAFRRVLRTVPPRELRGRRVYVLDDEWTRACCVGRLVDLDRLLEWCEGRAAAASAS
jgi:hypothetical protein